MANNKNSTKKLVTHDGSFHTDDVFACAALFILLESHGEAYEVVRTRDEEIIKSADYVFDVGGVYDDSGNKFDHHQVSFKEKRPNGFAYSSFGLVWKKFGTQICDSEKAALLIDKKLVVPVDAWDNGFDLVENKFTEISPFFLQHVFFSMAPTWREGDEGNDEMFFKSVAIAKEILSREIIHAKDAILAEKEVLLAYEQAEDKRIIILDQNYPCQHILHDFPEPLFAIYPRATNNYWGVKAIRQDPKTFKNRVDLPASWAGLREDELQKITGVSDAVFCHRALFMAVAETKEGAIKLAQIAVESKV